MSDLDRAVAHELQVQLDLSQETVRNHKTYLERIHAVIGVGVFPDDTLMAVEALKAERDEARQEALDAAELARERLERITAQAERITRLEAEQAAAESFARQVVEALDKSWSWPQQQADILNALAYQRQDRRKLGALVQELGEQVQELLEQVQRLEAERAAQPRPEERGPVLEAIRKVLGLDPSATLATYPGAVQRAVDLSWRRATDLEDVQARLDDASIELEAARIENGRLDMVQHNNAGLVATLRVIGFALGLDIDASATRMLAEIRRMRREAPPF